MSIRSRLVDEAGRYIARDEEVQAVAWGTRFGFFQRWLTGVIGPGTNSYRAIVCTDRRIMLFQGGALTASLENLLESVPRHTPLGPPHGPMFYRINAFTLPVYVARRFYRDIRLADSLRPNKVPDP
jgi:hypothetical protein